MIEPKLVLELSLFAKQNNMNKVFPELNLNYL